MSALATYVERGEAFLAAVARGELDEAATLLVRRTAAFHNFRALDALALGAGLDLGLDPEARALAERARALDPLLAETVQTEAERAKDQFARIKAARRKLDGYRNGGVDDARFTHSA